MIFPFISRCYLYFPYRDRLTFCGENVYPTHLPKSIAFDNIIFVKR